jgi:chemotaxis protein methyltransferase CheR
MPDEVLPEALCNELSELIAAHVGLHFPVERRADLIRGLRSAATELGFDGLERCAQWLVSGSASREQLNGVASHLTVGETYFFRERATLDALTAHVLPELIRARRNGGDRSLRIWSTACSTGEEPYSLAILLQQQLPDWQDWQITLHATDINEKALRAAAAGVYGPWSFRSCPPGFQERYFTRTPEGRFELHRQIRDLVTFAPMNLVKDPFPTMDLILCRNLLIYFTPQQAQALVKKLHAALADDGWLAVGPSECSSSLFSRFTTVNFPDAILYRKTERAESKLSFESLHAGFLGVIPPEAAPEPTPELTAQPTAELAEREVAPLNAAGNAPSPTYHHPAITLAQKARTLANEGRLAEARRLSERWLRTDKLDHAAHYLHATITQELGDHGAARRSLQTTIYLQPDFALGHFALGTLARRESRHTEARRHFETALRVLQNHPPEEVLPESDGMTASQLADLVATLLSAPLVQGTHVERRAE